MKSSMYFILVLVLSIKINAQQTNEKKHEWWFDGGVGMYGIKHKSSQYDGSAGFSLNFGSSVVRESHIIRLSFIASEEFVFFEDYPEKFKEVRLLYGRNKQLNFFRFSLLGGVSYLEGRIRGRFDSDIEGTLTKKISRVAMPIELNCELKISKSLSGSIGGFALINTQSVMLGLIQRFSFGNF